MKVLLMDQIASVNDKYSFSLANALLEAGCQVEMVIDGKEDVSYLKCPCHRRFETARKDIGKLRKAFNYVAGYRFTLKKAREGAFDVVHLEWFCFPPVDSWFVRRMRKKGLCPVAGVHDILPLRARPMDRFFHRLIYRDCQRIYVQAQANLERFQREFPEKSKKVSLIPHGHFLDFAHPMDQREARDKLSIPAEKKVFLFFGQVKQAKGLDVLIAAFARLRQKREDVFLLIAGNVWQDDFSQYQAQIAREGIENSVRADIRFIDEREAAVYFSACDLCVLPYRDVYQSGVLQLVYAYEKPVIATRLPAFTDWVTEGKTGYLCEPGNPESLLTAMERALSTQERWPFLARAGRERVRRELSWDKIGRQVRGVYEDALRARKGESAR